MSRRRSVAISRRSAGGSGGSPAENLHANRNANVEREVFAGCHREALPRGDHDRPVGQRGAQPQELVRLAERDARDQGLRRDILGIARNADRDAPGRCVGDAMDGDPPFAPRTKHTQLQRTDVEGANPVLGDREVSPPRGIRRRTWVVHPIVMTDPERCVKGGSTRRSFFRPRLRSASRRWRRRP